MPPNEQRIVSDGDGRQSQAGCRWTQIHHLVLIDARSKPAQPLVLFVSRKNGILKLPVVRLENESFFYSTERLVREVESRLGVRIAFLRCLSSINSTPYGTCENVVVGELLTETCLGREALTAANLNQMLARLPPNSPSGYTLKLVQKWLAGDSERRVPWSRLGWFSKTSVWLADRLRSLGLGEVAAIKQIRAWERSCVLSAETVSGRIFLKCVPEMFRHEPALTQWLCKHEPESAPTVLDWGCLPVVGHYLLMRDYGGQQLATIRDIKQWEHAIEDFALLQRRLDTRADSLGALGVPLRSICDLSPRAERMLADRSALQACRDGLTDAEVSELDKLLPTLRRAASAILSGSLAPSLDHGDLWSEQIIVRPSPESTAALFTDWSDCAISHPFMGLAFFCDDAAEVLLHEPAAYDRLRDCYLENWSDTMPRAELRKQFASAELLGPLQNALLYYEHILPSMEMAWEMEHMFMFHLRLVLKVAKRSASAA